MGRAVLEWQLLHVESNAEEILLRSSWWNRRYYKFPPAYILKEKEAASYNNELISLNEKVELPIIEIAFEECLFRIRYSINDKQKYLRLDLPTLNSKTLLLP